jgi:nucleoside-triphosphatase THEP1
MKGRAKFTAVEADRIREDLRQKVRAAGDEQKTIRNRMRRLGFYISDFTDAVDGFLVQDFDALVARGAVVVEPPLSSVGPSLLLAVRPRVPGE